jgi:predicted phosphodiesterase
MNHTIKVKKSLETAIVIPDLHVPYHSREVVNIAINLIKDTNPDHVILLGDCFDAEYLGRWTASGVEEGIYKTIEEIDMFTKEVYEPIKKVAKKAKLYWTGGNHDMQRIKEVIEELPDRAKQLNLKKMFPDIKMTEYNEWVKIGKMYFTHGVYTNSHHSKKTADMWQSNVMYGHVHDVQQYTKQTLVDKQPIISISLGSACSRNPGYMKNRPNNWVHALGIVYFQKCGQFTAYTPIIVDGKMVFNGKLYGN